MAFSLQSLDQRNTLLLSALFAILVASLYTFVGRRLGQRQVSPESKLAASMFSVWWYSLAGITLIGAFQSVLGAAGVRDLAIYVTITHVAIIILCVALAALLYYFAFLFTGRRGVMAPIVIFYVFYYICLVAFITYSQPKDIQISRWSTRLMYEYTIEGPILLGIIVLLLVPIVLGAIAYFSLFFRVHDRTQRYRIALVGGSITIWFSSSLIASLTGISANEEWQLVSRFIGVTAALIILWAYDPPAWVQRKLQVRSVVPPGSSP